ncbi:AbrB/MazE/SpoVT family DNA-binding domain-containing protein [Cytobacillus sp. FSL K6-0265]|uniref:AbrB/MazE/SpoVT family DNA-binding domain-containing protein n=1 Tax=Cytobacillus sp. FSL K6-0265 TaxID=2921448 RepID=UPI0030F6D9B7
MKSTGIVRKVDELGRVVIPIELRRVMDINIKDPLEIFVDEDQIILRKYSHARACMITGEISSSNVELAGGKIVLSRAAIHLLQEELKDYITVNEMA